MSRTSALWLLLVVAFVVFGVAFGQITCRDAHAQSADRWFVIDKFSGLDLLSEKTQLAVGASALAKNVQFAKPGTVSLLEGLNIRDTICAGSFPVLGLGALRDYITDSSRLVVACSTMFWNTYGNSWNFVRGSGDIVGRWQRWTDSLRMESVNDSGRAAEMLRPGWVVRHSNDSLDTINYISDNNTIFLKSTPSLSHTGQFYSASLFPPLASTTLPVKFVPIDIGGSPMMVCLQAGMEPVLYDGGSYDGYRFFGVADSGVVDYARYHVDTVGLEWWSADSSNYYIVDNDKIGLYATNELTNAGYWLHLTYGFSDYDSSHYGRIFPIDSNTIVDEGDTSQFRIYFKPGKTKADQPGGAFGDSLLGSRYQIISAPYIRSVYTKSQTPTASFRAGGRTIILPTGTISAREFDHIPHSVRIDDSATVVRRDSTSECYSTKLGQVCFWTYTSTQKRVSSNHAYPIRTSFIDTAGTDSIIIWTSGANKRTDTFTTSDWDVVRSTIPYASDGIVFRNQLYLAGDDQSPNTVVYSDNNGVRGPQIGAFPVDNLFELGSNADKFSAFALIYDWMVIFQRNHTWVLKGSPDDGFAPELALPDEGCIAPQSVVQLNNEVLYLSNKGWRLFDGNNARDFASPIRPSVQGAPRSTYRVSQANRDKSVATYMPTTGNIWMSQPFGTSSTNNGSFIYNAPAQAFSYSDELYGGTLSAFTFQDTLFLAFTSPTVGKVYTYGFTDSLTPVGIDGDSMAGQWESGWMDFGSPEELKYVEDGVFHVTASAPTTGNRKLTVSMFKDMDTTAFYADTTNVIGLITNVYYVANNQIRLEPMSEFQWLKIRIDAYGYSVLDFQRLALRWRGGADVVRDRSTVFRP